jgi:hypothetical protein
MDPKEQGNRRKASQKFIHALDELETVLRSGESQEDDPPAPPAVTQGAQPTSQAADKTDPDDISFSQLLDDAVRDIEQFMSDSADDLGA